MKDVLNPPDIEFYGELIPGPDYCEVVLSSTEYILESGESVPGPDLPLELFGHTITGINDTHSMVVGGAVIVNRTHSYGLDKTWIFDHVSGTFTNGPKLNIGRSQHSANIIVDSKTMEKTIVVTGGFKDQGNILDSSEILKGNKWEQGKCHIKSSLEDHSFL